MLDHLPDYINPITLADHGRRLKGRIALATLVRVTDVVQEQGGEVLVDLVFAKEGRRATVTGIVTAELLLQCQCCLGPMPWPVESKFRLGIVETIDAANLLPEDCEPLLLEAETIALADIVQDELLLAIPFCPQHENCKSAASAQGQQKIVETRQRPNPFGILADLKNLK